MKTSLVLLILGLGVSSCNNEATDKTKEDNMKNEVEKLNNKVDSASEELKDSVNQKWKTLKLEIEKKSENADSGK